MVDETTLTDSDEGKHVINADGDSIGRVVNVEHGTAHVDPDPGVTDAIMARLGWGDTDESETYQLNPSEIKSITDDEIRLSM